MTQHNTKSQLDRSAHWMAIGLSSLGLLIVLQYAGLTWFSAIQLDRQAIEQSTQRVQDMLKRTQQVQIAVSEEYGWWNDLVTALETRDMGFLSIEFDESIHRRYGITEVLALDSAGTPIYAAQPLSAQLSSGMLGWEKKDLQPIIDATQESSLEFPESAVDLLMKNGVMYIVTAAALTRYEYGVAEPAANARPTLLLMAPIDQAYLDTKATEVQVSTLRWSSERPATEGLLAVRSKGGDLQAYLSWTIVHPGATIISSAALWSAPIILLSAVLGALLLRRFRTLAEHARQTDVRALALEQSQTYFRAVSDEAPVLIWQTDLDGTLTYSNQRCAELLEALSSGDEPLKMTNLRIDDSDSGLQEVVDKVISSESPVHTECFLTDKKKQHRWLAIVGTPQRQNGDKINGVLFSGTDITDRKNTELLIWKQANFDALTQLANRSLLLDRLEQELAATNRGGAPGAIMFIDLDNFKEINDSLGHSAGDQVLKAVALRIADCLRDRDTVARFGGDEFVALLPGAADDGKIQEVAQRIRQALIHCVPAGNSDCFVTASIGVAYYPMHGNDSDLLLSRADKAMYRAKSDGRDAISFHRRDMAP